MKLPAERPVALLEVRHVDAQLSRKAEKREEVRKARLRHRLRPERAAAAAGRFGVRVVEHEPLADQVRVVVEHRAVQVKQALLVDVDLRTLGSLEHFVAEARLLLPGKDVAQPGTAAALDADAQSTIVDALLGHQRADLARRGFGNLDHQDLGSRLSAFSSAPTAESRQL